MRYVIYGAGAVGGTIAARLHEAGKKVVIIARGDHFTSVKRDGLLLRSPTGEFVARVDAVGSPSEITFDAEDIVLLTMKSNHTAAALDDLDRAAGDVPVICAQNGVANERMAARRFSKVYGMNIALPATFLQPGVVTASGAPVSGVLHTGCFPTGVDELVQQVTADLSASMFTSLPVEDVMRLKYAKLLINLTNGLDAILGGLESGGGAISARLRDEGAACFRAAGIAWADPVEYRERVSSHFHAEPVAGEPRQGSSTWQSLEKGHDRLEVDFLNGEICHLGKQFGVATPVNAAVRRLSQEMAARGERPGSRGFAEVERLLS